MPTALDVDTFAVGPGTIGLTRCPGMAQPGSAWQHQMQSDLRAIRDWGAVAVVTLNPSDELRRLGAAHLGLELERRGIRWHHLPVPNGGIPDQQFESLWRHTGPEILARMSAGERVLIHCMGGLGRSGTVAARLLVDAGEPPFSAIQKVRTARPGAIENATQEGYVMGLRCGS